MNQHLLTRTSQFCDFSSEGFFSVRKPELSRLEEGILDGRYIAQSVPESLQVSPCLSPQSWSLSYNRGQPSRGWSSAACFSPKCQMTSGSQRPSLYSQLLCFHASIHRNHLGAFRTSSVQAMPRKLPNLKTGSHLRRKVCHTFRHVYIKNDLQKYESILKHFQLYWKVTSTEYVLLTKVYIKKKVLLLQTNVFQMKCFGSILFWFLATT